MYTETMRKIFFGVLASTCCFAASANAGSIYDGIWLDQTATPAEAFTLVTKGTGASGDQAVVIDLDSTQTWWEGIMVTFTGSNSASFNTFLPIDSLDSGTVLFSSPTTATFTITSCTPTVVPGTGACPQTLPFTTTVIKIWP